MARDDAQTGGNDLEKRALDFATKAHASIDQRRKYTGEPYIVHPIAVAELVRSVPHTPEMIAAAYLHDVVEDTPVSIDEVRREFGEEVATLVDWLTDVSRPQDGTRRIRKELDRQHSAKAPAEAQTIKLADLIDNTLSIRDRDPHFWRVYKREKLALLEVLTRGDRHLWKKARTQAG